MSVDSPRFDHERRLLRAEIVAVVRRPTRRVLWVVMLGAAAVLAVATVATSGSGPRDLGALGTPVIVAVWCVSLLTVMPAVRLARAPGAVEPLRGADPLWFGLAGVADRAADWATRVRAWYACAAIGGAALCGAALLATAAPDAAARIMLLGAAPATAALLIAALTTRAPLRIDAADDQPGGVADERSALPAVTAPRKARRLFRRGALAYAALAAASNGVTGRLLVVNAVVAAALGAAVPLAAQRIGPTGAWLAALGIAFGAAARMAAASSRAPAHVAGTWFRLGGFPRGAMLATLVADALPSALPLTAFVAALAAGAASLTETLALLPLAFAGPVAITALARACDVMSPATADRAGVGAWLRIAAAWALLATAAFAAASVAPHGALAAIGAATVIVLAVLGGAVRIVATRMPEAAILR